MEQENESRRQSLSKSRLIVLKIGSAVLTRSSDKSLDRGVFCRIVEMVAQLRAEGRDVVIVTSGAVALGRGVMGCERPDRKKSLPTLQALAAIGQSLLMDDYERELGYYNLRCAQLLLTRADLEDRTRYSNARRTLETLIKMGVVPIINENAAVTCDQIRFGDNDTLSARVAVLCKADLLIIMSDIDAVYTGNPKRDPTAVRIDTIDAGDVRLDTYAQDSSGDVGTGGMITKVAAARMAAKMGIATLILEGKRPKLVPQAIAGHEVGTLLYSTEHRQTTHKAWLESLSSKGRIICDAGARQAITGQGSSLLPKGIVSVEGRFDEGEAVELADASGRVFARGLAQYNDDDIRRISGHHSDEIESILGIHVSDVIVHRNDLVLTD